jgi:hypothetical protein
VPGPGYYSPDKALKQTKVNTVAVDFKNSPGRIYNTMDSTPGIGSYKNYK